MCIILKGRDAHAIILVVSTISKKPSSSSEIWKTLSKGLVMINDIVDSKLLRIKKLLVNNNYSLKQIDQVINRLTKNIMKMHKIYIKIMQLPTTNNYNNVITNNIDDSNNNPINSDNLNNINNTNINNNNNNNNNSANTVDTNATTHSANISCNWNIINSDNPNNNNNISNNNINNNNNNSANTVDTNATTHSANITCKWNIITRSKKNHSDDNNNNNVNNNNTNNVFKYCKNNINNM
ncbi:hypothetical protein HELRODRAFT_178596 [Helobdella robusta]|uniref:Uncharacterized protein n=1 Tax=Helobdella robusta TaxID=6412 RepID=T1FDF9_HELRO|nr:hypothetical protein HELRODRAFT_178596 [Helobdella robusta]ESN96807.1 hypothetical protein HELRODRAFT_178596 [Helobdella robusta]